MTSDQYVPYTVAYSTPMLQLVGQTPTAFYRYPNTAGVFLLQLPKQKAAQHRGISIPVINQACMAWFIFDLNTPTSEIISTDDLRLQVAG